MQNIPTELNSVTYLIFVIDELQSESGVGQLHGLQ